MKRNKTILAKDSSWAYFLTEVTAPKEKRGILSTRWDDNYAHLSDCYGRYSSAKARAFNYCRGLCYAFGGYNLRIVSHNTFMFCVKFEFAHPETNELCTAYITPSHNKFARH